LVWHGTDNLAVAANQFQQVRIPNPIAEGGGKIVFRPLVFFPARRVGFKPLLGALDLLGRYSEILVGCWLGLVALGGGLRRALAGGSGGLGGGGVALAGLRRALALLAHVASLSASQRKQVGGAGGRDFRFSARRPIPADRRILHGTAHIKASLAVDGCTQQSDYRFRNAFRTCPNVRTSSSSPPTRQKPHPFVAMSLPVMVSRAAAPAAEGLAYR